jgi:hypothetical protein
MAVVGLAFELHAVGFAFEGRSQDAVFYRNCLETGGVEGVTARYLYSADAGRADEINLLRRVVMIVDVVIR